MLFNTKNILHIILLIIIIFFIIIIKIKQINDD